MGRNWDWSKQRGREKRLEAERKALQEGVPVPAVPPLHSHEATMQSMFNRGWNGVSQCDINIFLGKAKTVVAKGSPPSKLRSLRQCHLPQ